jgi:hypothetical protein
LVLRIDYQIDAREMLPVAFRVTELQDGPDPRSLAGVILGTRTGEHGLFLGIDLGQLL